MACIAYMYLFAEVGQENLIGRLCRIHADSADVRMHMREGRDDLRYKYLLEKGSRSYNFVGNTELWYGDAPTL